MPRILISLLGLACLATPLGAQDKLTQDIKSDLEEAQKRLSAQRTAHAEARRDLSQEITAKQNELLTKRRQADLSRRKISDQAAYLKNLEARAYASSVEATVFNDGLRAYGIQLHTRLFPGEPEDSRFEAIFQDDSDLVTSVESRLAVLELGLERLENALGGATYQGQVVSDSAELIEGEILSFGPSLWFQSKDKATAGSYHLSRTGQAGTLDPKDAETAETLFAGGEAEARIDITGGKARALAGIKSNPLDLIKKGGAWVYPILLLAAVALFCAIKKFFELRRIKDPQDATMIEYARQYLAGDQEGPTRAASSLRHPISQVLPATIQVLGKDTVDLGEEVLYERLIPVREKLRRWLPFLAITAATAPLLGLLGTVSGLIKTFSVIAIEGTGEAQSISGGISEALITTLFGLTVAIPAFMAHALLARKAKGIEQKSERLALVFLNEVRKDLQAS